MTKIGVVGLGFVGIAMAILLGKNNEVLGYDIDENKISKLKNNETPIDDLTINKYIKENGLNFEACEDKLKLYKESRYIFIATPTNYDTTTGKFDTSTVENIIKEISQTNADAIIVIKSTIPQGFVSIQRKKHPSMHIYFSPEFLREGKALFDNLYPSRVIVGGKDKIADDISKILLEGVEAEIKSIPVLLVDPDAAEAIKLFSNSFLALRVSFFNELDSFCEINNILTKDVISGVSLDPRIGDYYNNPSFGYGGYCLPKDTKQLLKNFDNVPNNIIKAIVDSNITRKDFIAERLIKEDVKTVGVYRIVMKEGSENFRESAVLGVINRLVSRGINVLIYEPLLKKNTFCNSEVIRELDVFKKRSEIIISNRYHKELNDVSEKFYTRDIYQRD
ncbi:nucleotide sugar dehydrogenase [Pelagibacteraceae bacterium]|nr:nucleotide sugar dehydrogenase [Pelagibacteraceae bacterium]